MRTDIVKVMRSNLELFDWEWISEYQQLSEEFIREFQDKVNWYWVSIKQQLSDEFIREFQDKVNWEWVSLFQQLSEEFIREFQDKVEWKWISGKQQLSEEFIREFQDKVDWALISLFQQLSEEFIREFQDKVDWELISKHQQLSEKFIREFQDKLDMGLVMDSWYLKSTGEKKQIILDTGLYECHADYFLAYKAIRKDRWSNYNFHCQYLPGGIYTSNCDHSSNENSYGLSCWTSEGVKNHDDSGLIVTVKVYYQDIGRVVHDSNKIRCTKIEILD